MRRKSVLIGFAFLSLLVDAQFEYDFKGKGARAAGMGYAFNAIADDATAIYWNPAGTAQVIKPEIGFVNSYTFTSYTHSLWSERDYKPVYNIDFLGVVVPFKIHRRTLTAGLAFQNQINYKSHYETYGLDGVLDGKYDNSITINTISLSAGFAITPYLLVGTSLNGWFSMGNTIDSYNYYLNYNQTPEKPQAATAFTTDINSSLLGANFSLGLLMDFTAFSLPLKISVKHESESILHNPYDEYNYIDYFYNDREDEHYTESFTGDKYYYMRRVIALGIGYRIGDYLTLACDFDIKPYKGAVFSWKYDWYDDYGEFVADTTYDEVYYMTEANSNLNQFRIGGEYIFHPKAALIPVRVGWKTNPTTFADYNEGTGSPEQMYAHSFNLGAGLIRDRFSIDLAYENYHFKRFDYDNYLEKTTIHFVILSTIINF